jgi:hypothetical protein
VPLTPHGRVHIEHMPSLSTTVKKVLGICNNPETPANDLNRVISLDPVLAGQVLRLINSAYYSLPKEITSLTRAIIMLGLNTVKNLALSTAALGSMGKKENFQALSADAFWFHAVSAGVTAKCLAVMKQVALANSYIRQMEAGTLNETPREAPLLKYFLNAIDIEWPQLLTIREAVQAEIEKAKIFLKLTEQ